MSMLLGFRSKIGNSKILVEVLSGLRRDQLLSGLSSFLSTAEAEETSTTYVIL